MDALVSVIVPVYNAEKYLKYCIESITKQSYFNLEIILIDDGSMDRSPQLCDEFASMDYRINVIHQENSGVSKARNVGLDVSKGEFIVFVDADDWLDDNYIEQLVDYIGNCDIIACNFIDYIGGKRNSKSFRKIEKTEVVTSQHELFKHCISEYIYTYVVWGKMYRKNIIGNVRFRQFSYSEDAMFCREILAKCTSVMLLTDVGYNYRINENSVTVDNSREEERIAGALSMLRLTKKLWEKFIDDFTNKELDRKITEYSKNYIKVVFKKRISNKKRVNDNLKIIKQLCYKQLCYKEKVIFLCDCIIYKN